MSVVRLLASLLIAFALAAFPLTGSFGTARAAAPAGGHHGHAAHAGHAPGGQVHAGQVHAGQTHADHIHVGATADPGTLPAGSTDHDGCKSKCCATACHAVQALETVSVSPPRRAWLTVTPEPDSGAPRDRRTPLERPPRSA
ncbi:hypothetical protein NK718_17800 [Alsobacter sp. SYSU M60028]|uniref:CopL family metal-binding regulatory protein n=1 Tax=Alsobacter ponti TaxID=2962936 RepID=A0ABT1LI59_9HYPH|nr:hypothetical protein [Alsobacter ponti]MCP8940385.1 hypothetical protein [Alsobacter ponti]